MCALCNITMCTNGNRIRAAVAIVVLRHRKDGQPIHECVEELRSLFPHEPIPSESSKWRLRAMLLRNELVALKKDHTVDTAELSLLRKRLTDTLKREARQSGGCKPRTLISEKVPEDNQQPQKTSISPFTPREPSARIQTEKNNIYLPRLNEPLSLLSPYFILCSTTSVDLSSVDDLIVLDACFCSATKVVSALGTQLKTVLKTSVEDDLIETVKSLRTLLDPVLDFALRLRKDHQPLKEWPRSLCTAVAHFFKKLVNDVVIPTINSFWYLSIQIYINKTQKSKYGKINGSHSLDRDRSDPRELLINLVHSILTVIAYDTKDKKAEYRRLLQDIFCETVKELSRCCSLDLSDGSAEGSFHVKDLDVNNGGRSQRVIRLARKDTIWYLCNLANPCLHVQRFTTEAPSIVEEEIAVVLSNIISVLSKSITYPAGDHSNKLCDMEKGLITALLSSILL